MVTDEERRAKRAANSTKWRLENKQRHAECKAKRKAQNALIRKELTEKHKTSRNISTIRRKNRVVTLLGDSYVKSTLCKGSSLRCSDIPQDLIEAKRQQLALFRASKAIKAELGSQK